jgi:hypothetical protein
MQPFVVNAASTRLVKRKKGVSISPAALSIPRKKNKTVPLKKIPKSVTLPIPTDANHSQNSINPSAALSSQMEAQHQKFKAVKPVFAESNYQVINNYISLLQLTHKPMIKISRNNKLQIVCYSVEDKLKVFADLEEREVRCWTFTEPGDKSSIFVLRGYIKSDLKEVLKNLKDENINAKSVTVLSDHPEAPVYLVHFDKGSININSLVHSHKSVGNVIVN